MRPQQPGAHGAGQLTPSHLLQVDDLSFNYPQRRLFAHWSARIASGISVVRGDEGSGKTSLLRLLSGELAADSGQLCIGTDRLDLHPDAYRSQIFRTDPWSEALHPITPKDWFDSLRVPYPAFDTAMLSDLLPKLSLSEHQHKPMYMLSTGSRRKVWLAAAFACGVGVTLLDQPFAALDKASIGVVLDLLREAARDPKRAWILADYELPPDIDIAQVIELH